jgi:hypothetical protein
MMQRPVFRADAPSEGHMNFMLLMVLQQYIHAPKKNPLAVV